MFLIKVTYSERVLAAPEIVYENEESIPAREKERELGRARERREES